MMTRLLALDLGTRRTGVAFFDPAMEMVLPLDTITSTSDEELVEKIVMIAEARGVQQLIVGIPLLPSGERGSQAQYVQKISQMLEQENLAVTLVDERHTTPRRDHPKKAHHGPPAGSFDGDAAAAVQLLQTRLDRTQEK